MTRRGAVITTVKQSGFAWVALLLTLALARPFEDIWSILNYLRTLRCRK